MELAHSTAIQRLALVARHPGGFLISRYDPLAVSEHLKLVAASDGCQRDACALTGRDRERGRRRYGNWNRRAQHRSRLHHLAD
jgi:hypothetical protein